MMKTNNYDVNKNIFFIELMKITTKVCERKKL